MSVPDRSSGQKFFDGLFSDAPYNAWTSDRGRELAYLKSIDRTLQREHQLVERAQLSSQSPSTPTYLPPPTIHIDTEALSRTQQQAAKHLNDLLDGQRRLLEATRGNALLQRRLQAETNSLLDSANALAIESIDQQHASHSLQREGHELQREGHELQREGHELQDDANKSLRSIEKTLSRANKIATVAALEAQTQRSELLRLAADSLFCQKEVLSEVGAMHISFQHQAAFVREHLGLMLADLGEGLLEISNQQAITRMSSLQSLYRLRSVFLEMHEHQMLSHQEERGVLEQILEGVWATERQKEARHLWKRAEASRREGQFVDALCHLRAAYELDDTNPLVGVSLATVHSSLGNADRAALAYSAALAGIQEDPFLSSYVLLGLASTLALVGQVEMAERAAWLATRRQPHNPETWFHYAKSCAKKGDLDRASECVRRLVKILPRVYRLRVILDPDLSRLYESTR